MSKGGRRSRTSGSLAGRRASWPVGVPPDTWRRSSRASSRPPRPGRARTSTPSESCCSRCSPGASRLAKASSRSSPEGCRRAWQRSSRGRWSLIRRHASVRRRRWRGRSKAPEVARRAAYLLDQRRQRRRWRLFDGAGGPHHHSVLFDLHSDLRQAAELDAWIEGRLVHHSTGAVEGGAVARADELVAFGVPGEDAAHTSAGRGDGAELAVFVEDVAADRSRREPLHGARRHGAYHTDRHPLAVVTNERRGPATLPRR